MMQENEDIIAAMESINKILPALAMIKAQNRRIQDLEAEIQALKRGDAASETTTVKKRMTKNDRSPSNGTDISEFRGTLDVRELMNFSTVEPRDLASPNDSDARSRSFSEDSTSYLCNTLHAPPTRLKRVCSAKSETDAEDCDVCVDEIFGTEEGINPMGVDALKAFKMLKARGSYLRSGFRLLTCNDEECEIQKIETGLVHLPHMTKQLMKLKWLHKPQHVLIVKKPHEQSTRDAMIETAKFCRAHDIQVYVEDAVMDEKHHEFVSALQSLGVIGVPRQDMSQIPVDFCVCLGGDGTIIWTCHLFPAGCPPVVSFAMGSMGFLSTFPLPQLVPVLENVLAKESMLTLRLRLQATVHSHDTEYTRTVLNEVVIDRGPNSNIVNLDLFIGRECISPVTHVQGDGIIISTPTGSTAYSLSAGGSMIYPSIPCLAVTPICPHSLSFRPLVLSDTSRVTLRVPCHARSNAWVAFDGQDRMELRPGDYVVVTVSEFPVPCIANQGEPGDFFSAIKNSLNWNERVVQKAIDKDA